MTSLFLDNSKAYPLFCLCLPQRNTAGIKNQILQIHNNVMEPAERLANIRTEFSPADACLGKNLPLNVANDLAGL